MYKKRILILVLVFTMFISLIPWQMSIVSAQELTQVDEVDFFYSKEECDGFVEELRNLSGNNFQELLQVEKNLINEFSFLLFTARNYLESSILEDGDKGRLVFVNEIKSQTINLNGVINENTLYADFENTINKVIEGNKESGKNILAKYGLYLSTTQPTIRLIPQYNTIEKNNNVSVDVVLHCPISNISDLGIFTFGLSVNYSDELSFEDIKKDGVSLINDNTPNYNEYPTYFETFDTSKQGEIAYGFCYKNTYTLQENGQELVIATLEFEGVNNGIGTLNFDIGEFVIYDTSRNEIFDCVNNDIPDLISYGTKIKVTESLNTEITKMYVNGIAIEDGGETTIASDDFILTGFVDADVDVKINGDSENVVVDDVTGIFTYNFEDASDVQEITVTAGNDEYKFTINVDTNGPEINITDESNNSLADGLYNENKTIKINFDGEENVELVSVTLNELDIKSYFENENDSDNKYTTSLEVEEEKDYILEVVAKDDLDNPNTKTINFKIDRIAPVITIIGVENNGEYGQTRIYLTSTEGNIISTLYDVVNGEKVNGIKYANGSLIKDSGSYALEAKAKDEAGNETINTINFIIDGEAPTIDEDSIKITVEGQETNTVKGGDKLKINFDVSEENIEGYLNIGYISIGNELSFDGTGASIQIYDMDYYLVPDDINAKNVPITVQLTDKHDNSSALIKIGEVTIDNKDPRVSAYIDSEIEYGVVKDTKVTVHIDTDGSEITYNVNDGNSIKTLARSVQFDIPTENNNGDTYIINYQAKDSAGNIASGTLNFTVDNVAPDKPEIDDIISRTNADTITLTISSDGDFVVIEKVVDQNNIPIKVSNSSSVTLKLDNGENNFVVYAVDNAMNKSIGTVVPTIIKDKIKPLISIERENDTLIVISNETLNDDSVIVDYTIDDVATDSAIITKDSLENTYKITGVNLDLEGKHVIEVRGTDLAGNEGTGTLTKITITNLDNDVDLTGSAKIRSESDNETLSGSIEVKTVTKDPKSGMEFASEPINITGENIVEGEEFVDGNGVVIDLHLGLGLPANTKLYYYNEENDEWIALNGNEHGDSLYNPGGEDAIVNPVTLEGKSLIIDPGHLVAVLHHFSTYGTMADTTPPEINITSPKIGDKISLDDLNDNNKLVVTGALSEDCTVTVNDTPATINDDNSFIAYINVAQGAMDITVVATDDSNNETTELINITVDTVPPTINTFDFVGLTETKHNPEDLTINVSEENNVITKTYSIKDDVETLVFTTEIKDSDILIPMDLEEGTNTFKVISIDEFGNASEDTTSIVLDTIGPEISIGGISDKAAVNHSVDINISLGFDNESGSWSAKLYTDESTEGVDYNSNFTIDAGAFHTYKLVVIAKDALENISLKEISFTIDNSLPSITVTGAPDNGITKENVTIVVSKEDTEALTTLMTKDGDPISFESGNPLTEDGEYSLVIIVTNTISEKTATQTVDFTIDKIAPVINVSVDNGGIYTNSVTPIITFEDNHSLVNDIETTITLDDSDYESGTLLNDKKEYKLVITATDEAGNTNTKSITFTIKPSSGHSPSHSSTSKTVKVTTNGGTFRMLSDEVVVKIDKDTFDKNVEVTVNVVEKNIPAVPKQTKTTKLMLAGKVYEFNAMGKTFNKPVEVTLAYDKKLVDDITKLGVYVYNETTGEWDYVGGKVNVKNGTVTVTLKHFSKYAVMEYDRTFTDVTTHWAKDDIELMASKHIANGMTTTTFTPQGKITRAQFATLLVRALGLNISENSNSFTDVNDEWFAGYVTTAYEAGLVNGMNATKFAPESNITREQMAAMIMRAYSYKTNNDYHNIATSTKARFNDESQISTWAHHAVLIANDLNIINGMGDDMFAPKSDATRAQAIVMIKRLLEAVGDI